MVAARNKRLELIVEHLRAQSGPVQVAELARLLDCSERSVHRYIEQLRSQEVPISSFLGPGGGLVLPGADPHSQNGVPSSEPPKKSFIGRIDESNSLDHALAQALEANRRIIALVGEAGIGKTRITEEFSALAEALAVEQV
jgi:DeoR/GlpR family transcriptional regulator of sugar metabolism